MSKAYDLVAVPALKAFANVGAFFNEKLKKGIDGRRLLQRSVEAHYAKVTKRPRILIHVASFGELEQAKPVIEQLALRIPRPHIHLTFFSPSGYENAKGNYKTPDLITYSPFDSERLVRKFLSAIRPDLALFVRYDVWPNLAKQLHELRVPSILFSATFDPKRESPLVKNLHRETYDSLSTILTISEKDRAGFERLGISSKILVAGDTRFDQVAERAAKTLEANRYTLPENIRQHIVEHNSFVIVAGSTWPEDEAMFDFGLLESLEALLILAPHEPTEIHVQKLMRQFAGSAIRLSDAARYKNERVVIVDSIGKLFGLYPEASVAYIGGGFSAGVHNVLEPAVWGKPVITGPRYARSQEVAELIAFGGAVEVSTKETFAKVLTRFKQDAEHLAATSVLAEKFVVQRTGATEKIMNVIDRALLNDHDRS